MLNKRSLCLAFGLIVGLTVAAALSPAADEQVRKYAVGDRVRVEWHDKEEEAEVVSVSRSGRCRVKFKRDAFGIPSEWSYAESDILGFAADGKPKPAAESEVLTWSDRTGKFKTRAALIKIDGDAVELRKEDGAVIKVPLAKLTDEDQKRAREVAAKLLADAAADEDPFKSPAPKSPPPTSPPMPASTATADGKGNTVKPAPKPVAAPQPAKPKELATVLPTKAINRSGLAVILLPSQPTAAYQPDPEPKSGKLAEGGLVLPSVGEQSASLFRHSNMIGMREVFPLADRQQAILVFETDLHSPTPIKTSLIRCDLSQGQLQQIIPLPATGTHVLDVDPSGRRLLAEQTGTGFKNGTAQLDVFELQGDACRHVVSWKPIEDRSVLGPKIESAAFVDAEHVLVGSDDQLTLWKATEAKAIWTMSTSGASSMTLSPQRKHAALATDSGVIVIDAKTGSLRFRLDAPARIAAKVAFSPDGKQLACVFPDGIQIWDLMTRKIQRDVTLTTGVATSDVFWMNERTLLIGKKLIDLELRVVLWNYDAPRGNVFAGQYWFAAEVGRDQIFAHFPLPHPQAVQKATELDAAKLLVLKPGSEAAINVDMKLPDEELQIVRNAMAEKATAAGLKVVDRSSLVLTMKIEPGKTTYYRVGGGFNRGFGGSRYGMSGIGRPSFGYDQGYVTAVSTNRYAINIEDSGKTVWGMNSEYGASAYAYAAQGLNAATTVWLKSRPNLKFFLESKLPTHIAQPGPDGTYGSSKITPSGIQ